MYYDNYNYEEAYQKQVEKLEEWEFERLLKEGRVNCLYRTTTVRSKNRKSGKEILEANIYPSYKNKKDMPRTKRKRESKPSQKNLNDKNARRYLIRLVNINFGKGDLWCTFGWDDAHMPQDEKRARKDIQNFISRINYRRKKQGEGNIRYVYILAFDGYERPHFHIVMTGDGFDRDDIEAMWDKCSRKNTRRIQPDDKEILTGMATYITQNPHKKKRWCSSKNLDKPGEPKRSYSKFKKRKVEIMAKSHETLKVELEKAYPGFEIIDTEVLYNEINAAFYIYARMTRDP